MKTAAQLPSPVPSQVVTIPLAIIPDHLEHHGVVYEVIGMDKAGRLIVHPFNSVLCLDAAAEAAREGD